MKKIYLAAAILFIGLVGLVGLGMAAIPAPPVSQHTGLYDSGEINVTTATCKTCHSTSPGNTHHFMVSKRNTIYGCADCHPTQGAFPSQVMYKEPQCNNCHNGTAFWANPVVNLTKVRPPGRPHHNQTKNSSSSGINMAYMSINRQCNACHGSGLVANYDDGHVAPLYEVGMVTPFADFKINSTVSGDGREYGGCAACHDAGTDVVGAPIILNNHDNHHGETSGMLGRQCNYCHVARGARAEPIPDWSAEPNAAPLRVWLNESYPDLASMLSWDTSMRHIELRNSTILATGDVVNGTGCEKCHTAQNLHNIQYNAAVTIPGQIPGFGHIGNNSDCNGCHQGWSAVDVNPFAGAVSLVLDGVAPSSLTANVATDVTLTGSNFVQDGYTTIVLIDGVATAPKSITDTAIVVTVNPTVGTHNLQVQKGDITSSITTVVATAPGIISAAKLTAGVITIDGTALGAGQTMVVVTKADGTLKASDSITTTTDTQIVAVSASAAVGDTVTVVTPTGEATATIEAAPTPVVTSTPIPGPSITSAKLKSGVLTIAGKGFETKPTRNPQTYVTTVRSGRTYTASSITSWVTTKIVAKVSTTNFRVGQTVTVKTVSGKSVSARITQG